MKLVIIGTGPGAFGLASSNQIRSEITELVLLETAKGKVNKNTKIHWPGGRVSTINKCKITTNPAEAIPNADIILLCNPANSYPEILAKIAPHVTSDTKLICGVPGAAGFDWMVRAAFEGLPQLFSVGTVESLPFIAKRDGNDRINIHAYKKQLYFAAQNSNGYPYNTKELEDILGVHLKKLATPLSISLLNPNAKVHPLLFLESLQHRDSTTKRNVYELGDENAAQLTKVEKEVKDIHKKLMNLSILPFESIPDVKKWFSDCYPTIIRDHSTVQTCLSSHHVYCQLQDDFLKGIDGQDAKISDQGKSRFLTEEIPYGMLTFKGLAELLNINTPTIDNIIERCQSFLSKQYIHQGKLTKEGILDSAAPQRFGIDVLSKLSRQYRPYSTENQLETDEFEQNGIVFYGKLLGTGKCYEIQKAVSERIANVSGADTEKLLLNLHWSDPRFSKFCSYPEFVDRACDLLGVNEVRVFSSLIVFKKPNEKMPVPWHQDPAYQWPLDPLDCASLWFALDDVTIQNGAMHMALGGHKVGILPMRPTPPLVDGEYHFSPQLSHSIAPETLQHMKIIHCDMRRYESSFHHSMMPHSSPINETQDRRCAFIVRYCRGDAKLKLYAGMPREQFFRGYQLFNPHQHLLDLKKDKQQEQVEKQHNKQYKIANDDVHVTTEENEYEIAS